MVVYQEQVLSLSDPMGPEVKATTPDQYLISLVREVNTAKKGAKFVLCHIATD